MLILGTIPALWVKENGSKIIYTLIYSFNVALDLRTSFLDLQWCQENISYRENWTKIDFVWWLVNSFVLWLIFRGLHPLQLFPNYKFFFFVGKNPEKLPFIVLWPKKYMRRKYSTWKWRFKCRSNSLSYLKSINNQWERVDLLQHYFIASFWCEKSFCHAIPRTKQFLAQDRFFSFHFLAYVRIMREEL